MQHTSFYRCIYFTVVLLTIAALWAGLILPIVSMEQFWVFSSEVSVLSAVNSLFTDGEILLSTIVVLFSIILPNVKLVFLASYAVSLQQHPLGIILEKLSRWAMLDVFLVAVLISVVKLGAITTSHSEVGLYWLTIATLATFILGAYKPKQKA